MHGIDAWLHAVTCGMRSFNLCEEVKLINVFISYVCCSSTPCGLHLPFHSCLLPLLQVLLVVVQLLMVLIDCADAYMLSELINNKIENNK